MKTYLVLAGILMPLTVLSGALPAAAMPFCTSVKTKIGDGSNFNTSQNCGTNLSRTMQVGNGTNARLDQVGRNNDSQTWQKGSGNNADIRQRRF